MTNQATYTLADIASKIGGKVQGDEHLVVHSLATLARAASGQVSFYSSSKYEHQLTSTKASAVIISADNASLCPTNAIICDNPYLGFAIIAQLLDTTPSPAAQGIAKSAVVAADVSLGKNVAIGENSVIESGVVLADGVVIGANCFIGKNASIGRNTKLWSNVSVYHRVVIGESCLVQANSVIGSDGFGYANNKGQWLKIPQLGSVIIGDRVEIGASTTVDRGALDDTIIANGVIIDNQCQIAHNVVIGENTAIAGCSVIAGSTVVGKQCSIGGQVGINGHITIADNTAFTGMTMVTKSITESGVYSSGMPAAPNKEWRKNTARLRQVETMHKRIVALEKTVETLTEKLLSNANN